MCHTNKYVWIIYWYRAAVRDAVEQVEAMRQEDLRGVNSSFEIALEHGFTLVKEVGQTSRLWNVLFGSKIAFHRRYVMTATTGLSGSLGTITSESTTRRLRSGNILYLGIRGARDVCAMMVT